MAHTGTNLPLRTSEGDNGSVILETQRTLSSLF